MRLRSGASSKQQHIACCVQHLHRRKEDDEETRTAFIHIVVGIVMEYQLRKIYFKKRSENANNLETFISRAYLMRSQKSSNVNKIVYDRKC